MGNLSGFYGISDLQCLNDRDCCFSTEPGREDRPSFPQTSQCFFHDVPGTVLVCDPTAPRLDCGGEDSPTKQCSELAGDLYLYNFN